MEKGVFMMKCLLVTYILTAGLLMLLALLVHRFGISEKMVSAAIIGIYVGATFFAGFFAGRKLKARRYLWGLLAGSLYFLILVVLSLLADHSMQDVAGNFFAVLVMCAGSGMLGGMVS